MQKSLMVAGLAAGMLVLAGCQTTPSYSFSEWTERPLADSRFDLPAVSNIPVTKLEQQDRNNGQIQNEKWTLNCGEGFVNLQYVPTAWFSYGTEQHISDRARFTSPYEEKGVQISDIHTVSNINGKSIGYYGKAKFPDGEICDVANFAVRMKRARTIYDNDRGDTDTAIDMLYCGRGDLDMETLTSRLSLVQDKSAFAMAIATQPKPSCMAPAGSADSKPLSKHSVVDGNLKWDGQSQDTINVWLRRNEDEGKFDFTIGKTGCIGNYYRETDDLAFDGGWKLTCDDGAMASGKFNIDDDDRLNASGKDRKSKNITFSIPLKA
ncbi:hypothetical protein [Thalassospira sp.]|uniref:hypothetical protein n=1 Tax=Thalassospira sp. TaxID=1912094 RepID=UPI0027359278|nr:hypothetical protein [Thalassospira sp.]MDP2696786.1 hypothetical protein [Thalassospira sp.]